LEEFATSRSSSVDLPVFAFSYVVDGEYYSGRFGLFARGDHADSLIREMVNRKLPVNYDPARPERWYIPNDMIEGCKVAQRIHLFGIYPRD
jgi:hypothetical protein